MKKIKNLTTAISIGLSYLFLAAPVLALDPTNFSIAPSGNQFGVLGNITLGGLIPAVIRILLIAAALVALVFLIIGGIKWITSGGDKAAVESARGTITNALIGLVIVFAAWAIIRLIEVFFNISIITLQVPNINVD